MVTGKSQSTFPPLGAAFFLLVIGLVMLYGGYHAWRSGDAHALGYFKGRSTVALPFGAGLLLCGFGVLFGNLVDIEHMLTKILMLVGAFLVLLAFVSVLWMPAAMRPGAGGRP
jgi:peptidoglycan/LPS O-acetylase OafA/YrhL